MSLEEQTDVGVLYDKYAVSGDTIKRTPHYTVSSVKHCIISHGSSELFVLVEAVKIVFACIARKSIFVCSWYCIQYCIVLYYIVLYFVLYCTLNA